MTVERTQAINIHSKFAIYLDLDMIYLHLPFRLLLIYYLHICKVEAHTHLSEQVCALRQGARAHPLILFPTSFQHVALIDLKPIFGFALAKFLRAHFHLK